MTTNYQRQTFVPIILSTEEQNRILNQPPYLHQQLIQEIYQKKQQKIQLQTQDQMNPQQQIQQKINQPSHTHSVINIPQIPTHPNQFPQVYQQGIPYIPQYIQQQQQQPQNQQSQQQNQIQNLNNTPLQHTVINRAGGLEIKYFSEWSTYLFMIETCISLVVNTISVLFSWEFVTNNYEWSSGLWIILILFLILNLFVLTNPSYVIHENNQKYFYGIHLLLYVLLMQGLQTAVSGYAQILSWETNQFYYFYLLICVEFISVRHAIQSIGVVKPIKKYISYLTSPLIVTFIIELFCQYFFFIYVPLFIWVIIVAFIGVGQIYIIKKIIQKGYNKFQTKDVFAMAISFPILIISPFFDEE